jgi:ribose 5-phosphate isomerase B
MTKMFRVVVGSDDAGLICKETLRKDLQANDRVVEVVDVGVEQGDDDQLTTDPHVAIAAAGLI